MACLNISSGKTFTCLENSGGIRRAWIANAEDTLAPTVSATSSMITGLNMVGGTASGNVYYLFEFKKNTGELKTSTQITDINGTVGFNGELKLRFYQNSQENFTQLESLVYNTTSIIVEDLNGRYWLLGEKRFCDVSALDVDWGKSASDFNGQDITFAYSEPKLPREINNLATITAVS